MNSTIDTDNIHTHEDEGNSAHLDNSDDILSSYFEKLDSLEQDHEISSEKKQYYRELLTDFNKFNLGKFILKNRGLNGFWADYLINYPDHYKKLNKDPLGNEITDLEKVFLEKLPITVATQHRHNIFKKLSQQKITNGHKVLAIPCGLSSELLQLDFSNIGDIELIGVDIDKESLDLSKQNAIKADLNHFCQWVKQDAWEYNTSHVDLIISNGLTMYIDDDHKVTDLYKKFNKSLNKSGQLITSFITPPPYIDNASSWDVDKIDPVFLDIQKTIFHQLFEARWHGYRTKERTQSMLVAAGFKEEKISFYPDPNNIFPTVVAKK